MIQLLRESRQQKRSSDSWRKNTKEEAPTAKSLVQICTSASLSAEWKHTNWQRVASKTTHLKLNAEFHPLCMSVFFNDWISSTSSLNKFSSPMRYQIEQLCFWSYFCIFFLGLPLFWNAFSAWFSLLLLPSSTVTACIGFFTSPFIQFDRCVYFFSG